MFDSRAAMDRARRAVVLAAAALLVAGCASDPYPLVTSTGSYASAARGIGDAVRFVVLYLEPRPGDRVELLEASAPGLGDGAAIRFYVSPPVIGSDGTRTVGIDLRPVAGAVIDVDRGASPGPDNAIAIVTG